MGIGATMKNMLSKDETTDQDANLDRSRSNASYDNREANRASHKLPSGTGPGTSGKAQTSELSMQQDLERSRTGQGISGYGTDAAAAAGGSLTGTHQGSRGSTGRATESGRTTGRSTSGAALGTGLGSGSSRRSGGVDSGVGSGGQAAPVTTARTGELESDLEGHRRHGVTESDSDLRHGTGTGSGGALGLDSGGSRTVRDREYDNDFNVGSVGHTGTLDSTHTFGHSKNSIKDSMPTGNAQEDTNQLNPVTHERVRHIETEEVARIKEHERHIHHIQHHTQPVIASEELAEQIHEHMHPVTHISEVHANKPEDTTLFEGQVHQHHDSLKHIAKERTIIDKGTTVTEKTHHHVHHVIQPVIEKETIDRQRIRTTIPIHEVTQEAPVVHQSQTHAPVPIEHFLQRGGALQGAISQDDIGRKVLHTGTCHRDVDGVAETLEQTLNLGQHGTHGHTHSTGFTDESGDFASKKAAQRNAGANVDQPALATSRN